MVHRGGGDPHQRRRLVGCVAHQVSTWESSSCCTWRRQRWRCCRQPPHRGQPFSRSAALLVHQLPAGCCDTRCARPVPRSNPSLQRSAGPRRFRVRRGLQGNAIASACRSRC